jgi:uncharacterized membrane protein YgcG
MMTVAVMVLCSQVAPVLLAQNSNSTPASAEAAAPAPVSETRPVQLSSGVPDILKLGRAHMSDEAITAFISNSGRTYHLSVSEILYLREQGVSDQVVTAMLNSRQNAAATVAQVAPQPAPTGPTADWVNNIPQPAPAPAQYAPTYVAAAPVYTQPSPVYVYPPSYEYYDSWPYYWGYPSVSFGFGFGGGHYGGYHGGGYHGGGYHGGGGGGGHR